jgi:hypothetical protein
MGEANVDSASILKRFGYPVYSVNHVSINASQTPSTLFPNEALRESGNVAAENLVAVSTTY